MADDKSMLEEQIKSQGALVRKLKEEKADADQVGCLEFLNFHYSNWGTN